MQDSTLREDPVIVELMQRLPADSRASFSDEQLLALKAALSGRSWGNHAIDLRWTLKFWRWHYYFVFLLGNNRRQLSRREKEIARMALLTTVAVILLFSALFGLLLLYLIKSALGINLFDFSLGIWGWFQHDFMH